MLIFWVLVLSGCRSDPSPPSRNLFYEVKTLSPASTADNPLPATVSGDDFAVEIVNRDLIPSDFQAMWDIDWQCNSDNCRAKTCEGTAKAYVRDVVDERWLEIDRRITWAGDCGERTTWLSQIDKYTGQERYPSATDTLFEFWAGAHPGAPNDQIQLANGKTVSVWCTGPRQAEMPEEDGWTTLYDGEICYDTRTGMLVFMNYIKRWVFTGSYNGQEYTRAYFGDSETYEQRLTSSNAQLNYVE
jgi:hypothetical protein